MRKISVAIFAAALAAALCTLLNLARPSWGWIAATAAMLAVSALTDLFDGRLARRWGVVSRIGALADPLMDKLFYVATLPTATFAALWLGDMYVKGSQFMRATYGNYLKSDMCQVAHHGRNGCEWEFYQLAAPKCLWWPAAYSEVTGKQTDGTSTWKEYVVDRHLYYDLASVEYIIVCDLQNVTVTITKDGPQYALDQLYNADTADHTVTQYGSKTVEAGILKIR